MPTCFSPGSISISHFPYYLVACLLQEPEVKYAKVSSYCAEVLERKPGNPKALYRYGLALYHSKDYDGALSKLHKALQQSPSGEGTLCCSISLIFTFALPISISLILKNKLLFDDIS